MNYFSCSCNQKMVDWIIVMDKAKLETRVHRLIFEGKGILAADESTGSIKKRFDSVGVASTPENHRLYRQMLFTTPNIKNFISGVILFDETIRQNTDGGIAFPDCLAKIGITPGIKVDMGAKDMANFPGEKITEGLDSLRERLSDYVNLGAEFTKWRAVIKIDKDLPTDGCIYANCEALARFAALSQEQDMVPIVEPEVLMEGSHTLERSAEVSKRMMKNLFIALSRHRVYIKGMLLKASWVHPGFDYPEKSDSKEIAKTTLRVFKEVLPDELPGVVFLSGGDSPEDSTDHLDKLNELENIPWKLSFSFGRALQEPALKAWVGKSENIAHAQQLFYERARLNSLARSGDY